MTTIKLVTELSELEGIKSLQEENLRRNKSASEADSEGFVTAEYSIEFLQTLHRESPSIIARDQEKVIGYALVALPSVRHQHALLGDLMNAIDQIEYKQRLLKNSKYVVVGQLCVARQYRGRGLVQQMYEFYKTCLSGTFEYCITDVAENNPRSLKAHQKSGFQIIDRLEYGGSNWDIILWDWHPEFSA